MINALQQRQNAKPILLRAEFAFSKNDTEISLRILFTSEKEWRKKIFFVICSRNKLVQLMERADRRRWTYSNSVYVKTYLEMTEKRVYVLLGTCVMTNKRMCHFELKPGQNVTWTLVFQWHLSLLTTGCHFLSYLYRNTSEKLKTNTDY